ncbi:MULTISPECIES: phosphatase PAP2 family protein [unclassified Micromonospora]|uniref:phosphatase PAP2 family protein n=1 Tax=unclassified Micromonospora TaxID=2617518 RepID=UPI001C216101|nr:MULTISPECIES: phosphatase PAP2 family protein [unclassified Micromonospora]MBU8857521.1 phosphatase PAP2 family protein [Micromonospora sp. WMMB482]MDM4783147.1 phosphatase PAP2 family protein [Micromonospora sp. b486]
MDTSTGATVAHRSWRSRRLDPEHSLGLRLTLTVVAAFLVLVPFALLALLVLGTWPPLQRLDASIAEVFHGYARDHPAWVGVMTVWTHVFGPGPLRVAAVVLVVWLVRRGAPRLAVWVVVTMVAGGLLGALLKLLVGRDRPDLLAPVARAAGYSFPSGHALNATLAAGVLLLVFLPFVRASGRGRVALWTAALLVTVVTGLSRIALGVHWISDVVGGWVLGVAVVAATSAAFATWRSGSGRPSAHPLREGVEPALADQRPENGRA